MVTQPNTLTQPNPLTQPPPTPPSPHKTPFALRVLIALFLFKTVGFLFLVILATVDPTAEFSLNGRPAQPYELSLSLSILVVLGLLGLVAAIGLWQRKRWAWVWTMILLAASMTLDIISYFQGEPSYFSMALNVIQVGYLNQTEVQDLFGAAAKPDAP